MFRILFAFGVLLAAGFACCETVLAEPLRKAKGLEQLLKELPTSALVAEVQKRGNAPRGAVLFHRSIAACSKCHSTGSVAGSVSDLGLGPNLSTIGPHTADPQRSREYWIDALLYPSKDIRKGYETVTIRTIEGDVVNGIVQSEDDDRIMLRSPSDLASPVEVLKSTIEARSTSRTSLMPDGLISSMREERDFYDLAAYVIQVAEGGPSRAAQLQPTHEQLAVREDWLNLDHAGIIKSLKAKDFDAGKAIYEGYCIDCHGSDGNRATLPTARAFGSQAMKFGADPYRMFMTLTQGNGLMGPMSHLTPHERYEVVHYIREHFMKENNSSYSVPDRKYLESLPKGTEDGKSIAIVERDYGPALASQLERRFRNVLSVRLGASTLAYDLHTMNQAEFWSGGFLDLSDTQHQRNRGEGTPKPIGKTMAGLQGWEWGHDGLFDYSRGGLLPRGPLPDKWMKYRGYHLHGSQVILSYRIDGRDVLERASLAPVTSKNLPSLNLIQRRLEIGPGKALVLSVLKSENGARTELQVTNAQIASLGSVDSTNQTMAILRATVPSEESAFSMAAVLGDAEGFQWTSDRTGRLILTIPESDRTRLVDVITASGVGQSQSEAARDAILRFNRDRTSVAISQQLQGGPTLWPEIIQTVGYLGLQQDAYVLDTLTIPSTTSSNTWFRTTALDFLSDGRMVVSTHGGDVWIVSGIDRELLQLKWKRFAAGLYEPMGVKVVDDQIYLTCKDRIVRLHDRDNNGEADFYENFSDETDISFNFHAFNFDLQTDSDGNFYYAKGGNGSDMALPGAVMRISADGTQREAFCTGFRAPNGMGALPSGLLTCSDNQGHWIPASKVNLLKPGGFYGWVQTYDGKDKWAPDGGRIDVKKVVPPKTFDQPLVWMPQEFDNSSGGQIWVDDPRWGPLSGRLPHTSFGKGWLAYMMLQELDGVHQAAIIKLPYDFRTGIMRGRVNPRDGQVYLTGLQGWNGGGRIGLLDQGIQRLRYTGKPIQMVTDCQVERDGLRVSFNFPLEANSVKAEDAFEAKHWNYKWQASYGSEMHAPSNGQVGTETLSLEQAKLSADRHSVLLSFRELRPVDQLQLRCRVRSDSGAVFEEEIYWTIHRLPQ